MITLPATATCTTLPKLYWNQANSVKSNQYLMLFKNDYCKGRSYELPPGRGTSLPYFQNVVKSFRLCQDDEKDLSNNWINNDKDATWETGPVPKKIQFFDNNNYQDLLWDTVVESACMNMPKWVVNKAASLKTEVCIVLYSLQDCRGDSQRIQGDSPGLPDFFDYADSFRPCRADDILGEVKLTITVIQIKIVESSPFNNSSNSNPTKLTKSSHYRHNSTATNKENVEMKLSYLDRTEITRSELSSSSHKVNVALNVGFKTSIKIPFLEETDFETSFSTAYTYEKFKKDEKIENFVKSKTVEVAVNQKVTVPPCSLVEVTSYVNLRKDVPMKYIIHADVSGTRGDKKMLAKEVKGRLDGMDFIEAKGDFTVVARTEGNALSDFSMDTGIYTDGVKIDGCGADTLNNFV